MDNGTVHRNLRLSVIFFLFPNKSSLIFGFLVSLSFSFTSLHQCTGFRYSTSSIFSFSFFLFGSKTDIIALVQYVGLLSALEIF